MIDRRTWEALTPFLRPAAIPFSPRRAFAWPEPVSLPVEPPYLVDTRLPADDQRHLHAIAEGLRLSRTGRYLYGYLGQVFAPATGRRLTLNLVAQGLRGDRAITSGRPPSYVVTFNRDLVTAYGTEAMVPKLAHEIVHLHDYLQGRTRSVAMEVSAHAADAAVAYETNQASRGRPAGPYSLLISLRGVYEAHYVPFRRRPTAMGHEAYWRALMHLVLDERAYRNAYVNAQGETERNSPPGTATDGTYVPYDPAFGWPENR